MKVGIVDADLIGRKDHRFPNLACMKLSGYWKGEGADVNLVTDWDNVSGYDTVYVAKVFTDTPVPDLVLSSKHIIKGGTGFSYDKAKPLPHEVEHTMPDYGLYNNWLVSLAQSQPTDYDKFVTKYSAYIHYSVGYLTRGCFRHCPFCVNRTARRSVAHSPLDEFYIRDDPIRRKLCFLDDNFFAYIRWRDLLESVLETDAPFMFKQGLDARLLDVDKCVALFNAKYDGDFIFAFDSSKEYDTIHEKLKLIRQFTNRRVKFYVLAGYPNMGVADFEDTLLRIELLLRYGCLPYIMRFKPFYPTERELEDSPWPNLYTSLTRWCNQVHLVTTLSFREFCEKNQAQVKTGKLGACMGNFIWFEKEYPDIARRYFDVKFQAP